jgi:hypothetical protein
MTTAGFARRRHSSERQLAQTGPSSTSRPDPARFPFTISHASRSPTAVRNAASRPWRTARPFRTSRSRPQPSCQSTTWIIDGKEQHPFQSADPLLAPGAAPDRLQDGRPRSWTWKTRRKPTRTRVRRRRPAPRAGVRRGDDQRERCGATMPSQIPGGSSLISRLTRTPVPEPPSRSCLDGSSTDGCRVVT